jgi:hypothetical protein
MARLKRLDIKKHHVLRITDWTYSITIIAYGAAWAFVWTRLALRGESILVWNSGRTGRGTTSTTLYPIGMWFFALCGAYVVAIGIRNIRRLLANQSIN